MRRPSADRGAALPGVILVAVGVLLVAAAGVLKWVIVPSQTKLPANLNVNLAINGTYSGINNAALDKGDLAHLKLENAPITFYWSVHAEKGQGGSLLVSDTQQIVLNSDGTHLTDQAFAYSMDAKTVQLTNTFTGKYALSFPQVDTRNPAPKSQTVPILNPPPNGVTINFPFSTPKSTVTGYNVYSQQTVPLSYAGNSSLANLTSQNYVDTISPYQRIVAPTALAQLPPAFPKAMIGAVAPLLGLPADVQAKLQAALPTLPDSVPLSYWYTDHSTFNVEPTTGVVLAIDQDQKWVMQIDTKAGPLQLQVLELHIVPTPSALTRQANLAKSNINKLDLMGNWVPLAMLVVGVLLIVGGVLLIVRRRPQAAEAVPAGAMDRPHVPATGRTRPAPDQADRQPLVEVGKDHATQT
jgi:hypothetical protein